MFEAAFFLGLYWRLWGEPSRASSGACPELWFSRHFRRAVRRKLLIVLLALVGAGIAALLAMRLDDEYDSTAQILIDPRELKVVERDLVPQSMGGDASTAFLSKARWRIITSANMLRRIVEQEKLAEDSDFLQTAFRIRPLARRAARSQGGSGRQDDAGRGFTLSPSDGASRRAAPSLSTSRVTTSDPAKSARLANVFVEAYIAEPTEQQRRGGPSHQRHVDRKAR